MTVQDIISQGGGAIPPTILQASHSIDFSFQAINTPEPIPLNTNDAIINIVHPTGAGNSEITIIDSGVYFIAAQPQVFGGSAGTFHMWLQRDQGGGFIDVPNSNVELALANNGADVIPLIAQEICTAGDVVRLVGSVSAIGVRLESISPAGEPLIPSMILTMFRSF